MSKNEYEILYKGRTEDECNQIDGLIESVIYNALEPVNDAAEELADGGRGEDTIDDALEDINNLMPSRPAGITDDDFRDAFERVTHEVFSRAYVEVNTDGVVPALKTTRKELQIKPLTRTTKISPLRNSQDE